MRIGVARGERGSGLEGLAPSMWAADALFQCFSAVAELLVILLVSMERLDAGSHKIYNFSLTVRVSTLPDKKVKNT